MLNLSQNNRFKKDLERYHDAISKTDRDHVKKELTQLTNKLIASVRSLDSHHYDMIISRQKNNTVADIREEVASLRKRIEKIIKDLNQA